MAQEVGVIHEDCAGFGDGFGFNVLNESEKEKFSNQQALNEKADKAEEDDKK